MVTPRRPLAGAVQTAMVAFSTNPLPPVAKRFNRHEIFSVDVDRQFAVVADLLQQLPVPSLPNLPESKPHPNPTVAAKQKTTYAMMLSYNGGSFLGGYEFNPSFPPEKLTVQGVLTDHIKKVAGISHKLWVATAGRTDAKVSAKGALVSFATRSHIDQSSFIDDLNNCFPNEEMRIHGIREVDSSFHASFATMAREYVYVLPVLKNEFDDSNKLQDLADVSDSLLSAVVGEELDYLGISAGKVKTQTTLCKFLSAGCWYYGADKDEVSAEEKGDVVPGFKDCWSTFMEREGNEYSACLVYKLKSNRFLKRMIRKLVNSVLMDASDVLETYPDQDERLARKEQWKEKWRKRVETKDRGGNDAAPPEGLCLWRVDVL